MLGAAVEDIAQFLHQEERLDSVSQGVVWHAALWADVASHWLTPPACLALSATLLSLDENTPSFEGQCQSPRVSREN